MIKKIRVIVIFDMTHYYSQITKKQAIIFILDLKTNQTILEFSFPTFLIHLLSKSSKKIVFLKNLDSFQIYMQNFLAFFIKTATFRKLLLKKKNV